MEADEVLFLLAERGEVERMLAETTEDEVIDRASCIGRLARIDEAVAEARARLKSQQGSGA